jgi:hypothetical protein
VKPVPPPRLALLRAARRPIAVILRRGPSKWVEVLRWDFRTDSFERGHWFHGRIYGRRSDLSPDGELMVYFANQFNRDSVKPESAYTYAWTAVSRVPWLTALALWPKGDCWAGGGLFTDTRALWLNHTPDDATPHPAHMPRGLHVTPDPDAGGEDEPIYSRRLERDGWAHRTDWVLEWQGERRGYRTITPGQRVKPRPATADVAIVLLRRIDNLKYREHFQLEGAANELELPPGPLDWLDWDSRGRLIALSGGRIWAAELDGRTVGRFRELLDLRGDEPEHRSTPPGALVW